MFCAEIHICMKENIQTGNTGISQDKIGTAADDNTVLFCCELKDQLFLSLVNSIMGTEITCRVIQNVVQKSGAAAQIFTLTINILLGIAASGSSLFCLSETTLAILCPPAPNSRLIVMTGYFLSDIIDTSIGLLFILLSMFFLYCNVFCKIIQ